MNRTTDYTDKKIVREDDEMTKTIVFPAMNVEEEAKIKRLSETMAEFMGAVIKLNSVVMLAVEVEDDRSDVASVFSRLAMTKKNTIAMKMSKAKDEIKG